MGSGLFSLSAWVTPFGFLESERESEPKVAHGFESDLVGLVATYATVVVLDIVTLPLSVFWAAGVCRQTDRSERGR